MEALASVVSLSATMISATQPWTLARQRGRFLPSFFATMTTERRSDVEELKVGASLRAISVGGQSDDDLNRLQAGSSYNRPSRLRGIW